MRSHRTLRLADAVVLFAPGTAIVSAPAYAGLLGLDAELALLGELVGTLLLPLIAPPLAWALTGVDLTIGFAARLGIVVGLPLLLSRSSVAWSVRDGSRGWAGAGRRLRRHCTM